MSSFPLIPVNSASCIQGEVTCAVLRTNRRTKFFEQTSIDSAHPNRARPLLVPERPSVSNPQTEQPCIKNLPINFKSLSIHYIIVIYITFVSLPIDGP